MTTHQPPTPTPRTTYHVISAGDLHYLTHVVVASTARKFEQDIYGVCSVLGHPITPDDTADSASSKVVLAMTDLQAVKREVDALKEQLRQKDDALKAANELRVSGGDTVKGGIVRAFVEFPAGTPIRVVSTLGDCIKAMDDLRESLRITGTGTGEPVFTPGTANYTH